MWAAAQRSVQLQQQGMWACHHQPQTERSASVKPISRTHRRGTTNWMNKAILRSTVEALQSARPRSVFRRN
eukprot:5502952-Amphidinium_carterae.1